MIRYAKGIIPLPVLEKINDCYYLEWRYFDEIAQEYILNNLRKRSYMSYNKDEEFYIDNYLTNKLTNLFPNNHKHNIVIGLTTDEYNNIEFIRKQYLEMCNHCHNSADLFKKYTEVILKLVKLYFKTISASIIASHYVFDDLYCRFLVVLLIENDFIHELRFRHIPEEILKYKRQLTYYTEDIFGYKTDIPRINRRYKIIDLL